MPSTIAELSIVRDVTGSFPIVLVTGGAGYIGSHTVLEILKTGCAVVVVDNLVNSHIETLIRVYHVAIREYMRLGRDVRSVPPLIAHRVDLCDRNRLSNIFEIWQNSRRLQLDTQQMFDIIDIGALAKDTSYKVREYDLDRRVEPLDLSPIDLTSERIIAVIHFAALKAVGESISNLLQYFQNNITGLLNLLDCMTVHKVNRLVCSSTAVVHSFGGKEGSPNRDSANPYYRSKRMAEEILHDCCIANPSLEVVALRYPTVTGSHPSGLINENPRVANHTMLADILESVPVKDVADGHVAALRSIIQPMFKPNHRIYSLGTGQGYWGLEIIKSFATATDGDISLNIVDGVIDDLEPSTDSATRSITMLGWEADFDIQDMCRDLYIFSIENPEGYERLRKLAALALKYPQAMKGASIAAGVWQAPSGETTTAFLKHILRQIMIMSSLQATFDEMCHMLNTIGDCVKDERGVSNEIGGRHIEKADWSLQEDWQEVSLPIRTA